MPLGCVGQRTPVARRDHWREIRFKKRPAPAVDEQCRGWGEIGSDHEAIRR